MPAGARLPAHLRRSTERGELLLDELVTRTYALDDVAAAFDDLLAGRNAKGVLVVDDS